MATVDVMNTLGNKVATTDLADSIFDVEIKKNILHQVVTAQLARRRAGTAAVKNRSDVHGSTRKLFRQKGTGRARRGDIKSPVLRSGGVVFGPHPRSYEKKVSKKIRRLALKMALSSKLRNNELLVLERFDMEQIKTKDFCLVTKTLDAGNALIVIGEKDNNLELSSRNVPGVKVLRSEGLNVFDILKYKKLVLLENAVRAIEGRLI